MSPETPVHRKRAPSWRCGAAFPRATARGKSLGAVLLLAALGACATARPPRTAPAPERFRWAANHYERGNYGAAIRGFKDFLVRSPLHAKSDSAQFLLASSYMKDGSAEQAATEFRQIAVTRPGSPLADDAQLGACRAHWQRSPGLPRTQEPTRKAIEECQRLIEFFPESSLIPEAKEIISEARSKLAAKQYRIARYYYDEGFYESANIYLESLLEQYPDASVVPRALLTLYRSYRELGFDSEARSVRERLLSEHSDSPEARELRQADNSGGD